MRFFLIAKTESHIMGVEPIRLCHRTQKSITSAWCEHFDWLPHNPFLKRSNQGKKPHNVNEPWSESESDWSDFNRTYYPVKFASIKAMSLSLTRHFTPCEYNLRSIHTVRFFLIATAFLMWIIWQSMEVFILCVFFEMWTFPLTPM